MFYWNKIHSEGNLSYLVRSESVHIAKKKPSWLKMMALSVLWRQILDDYIARFGFSEQYLEILRKQKELAGYKIAKLVNDDRSLNSFIRICEKELAELEQVSGGGDFYTLKGWIEKSMGLGYSIDPMKMSVAEFHSYAKIAEAQQKAKAAQKEA